MDKVKLFQNEVLGSGFDIDGYFGWQCWDGYAKYCLWLGVPFANCMVSGYVKDLWEQRYNNGILDYFDEVENLEGGEVVIFTENEWTPLSVPTARGELYDHTPILYDANGTARHSALRTRQWYCRYLCSVAQGKPHR